MRYGFMLCSEGEFRGDEGYSYELKFDGTRAMFDGRENRLYSRRGVDISSKFPEILSELKGFDGVLDGEIVCFLNGRFDTNALRERELNSFRQKFQANKPCLFYVFDILEFEGESLIRKKLRERKHLLSKILQEALHIKHSPSFEDRESLWKFVLKNDFEGIIAKDLNGIYIQGKRTPYWIKIKNWKEKVIPFTDYELNENDTITLLNGINRLLCPYPAEVIKRLKEQGKAEVLVRYLYELENKKLREASYIKLWQ